MSWVEDRLEDFGDSVGNFVEGVTSDPKKLAALAVSIAFPGAAAWIGSQVGLTGVAATIAGNTVLGTISNGGDVGEALKGAVIGAGVQGLSDTVRASLAPGQDPISVLGGTEAIDNTAYNIEKTLSDFAGKATSDVALATLMGKDPVAALMFSGSQAASGLIMDQVLSGAGLKETYSSLPSIAKDSINAALSASLTGKDISKAAASAAVNSAIRGLRGAINIQGEAQKQGRPAFTTDELKTYTFAGDPSINSKIADPDIAGSFVANLTKAEDILGEPVDENVAKELAQKSGFTLDKGQNKTKVLDDESILVAAAMGNLNRLVTDYGNPGELTFQDVFRDVKYNYEYNQAVKQGWSGGTQQRDYFQRLYGPNITPEQAKLIGEVPGLEGLEQGEGDKYLQDIITKWDSKKSDAENEKVLADLLEGYRTTSEVPITPAGVEEAKPTETTNTSALDVLGQPMGGADNASINDILQATATPTDTSTLDNANAAQDTALLNLSSADVGQGEQAAIDQSNLDALLNLSSADAGQGEVDAINHDALLNLSSADVGQGETDAINYDALLGLSSAEVGQGEQKAIDDATNTGDTATGGTGGTQTATSTGTQTNTGTNTGANVNTQAADDSGANLLTLLALMGSGQRPQQQKQAPAEDPYVDFDWSKPFQINPFATQTTTPKMYGGGSIDELLELLQHRG